MRHTSRHAVGILGALFVSTCCLGAAPVLVSAATVVGLGAVSDIFNIFVLGPIMTISVAWIAWNLARQGTVLTGAAWRYLSFWIGFVGGLLSWTGVLLPHIFDGTRGVGIALIVVGLPLIFIASLKSLWDQRHASVHVKREAAN